MSIKKKQERNQEHYAIIAGGGSMPLLVIDRLLSLNCYITIFCLDDKNYDILSTDSCYCNNKNNIEIYQKQLCDIADIVKIIKKNKVQKILCCGWLKFRGLRKIKWYRPTIIKYLIRVLFAKQKGDNFLLSIVEKIVEDCGSKLVAVQDVLPNLLCTEKDAINIKLCSDRTKKDIDLGLDILNTLSKFDIGQAIVVQNGRVLGIEGTEGTDGLIGRCGELAIPISIEPILIKTAKIGQSRKLDMPTIGIGTFKKLLLSGFCGLAVGEGDVLILDKEEIVSFCKKHKLFLYVIHK